MKLIRIKDGEKELACIVADDLSGVSINDNYIDLIYNGKLVQLVFANNKNAGYAYALVSVALEAVEETAIILRESLYLEGVTMSKPSFCKTVEVIRSCRTQEQFDIARRYSGLYIRATGDLMFYLDDVMRSVAADRGFNHKVFGRV